MANNVKITFENHFINTNTLYQDHRESVVEFANCFHNVDRNQRHI